MAVKLYNEIHPDDQLSGNFDGEMFNKLSQEDDQGYIYLPNAGSRWAPKDALNGEYSLKDADSVLKCKYSIPSSTTVLMEAKCQFDKIDQEGTECYRFLIDRNDPDVVKKDTTGGFTCEDL